MQEFLLSPQTEWENKVNIAQTSGHIVKTVHLLSIHLKSKVTRMVKKKWELVPLNSLTMNTFTRSFTIISTPSAQRRTRGRGQWGDRALPQHGHRHCRLSHWHSSQNGQWHCTQTQRDTADIHIHFHFLLRYFHHLHWEENRDFRAHSLIRSEKNKPHTPKSPTLTDIKEVHVVAVVSILHFIGHNPKSHDLTKDQYVWFGGVDLDFWVVALVGQSISCHCKQVPESKTWLRWDEQRLCWTLGSPPSIVEWMFFHLQSTLIAPSPSWDSVVSVIWLWALLWWLFWQRKTPSEWVLISVTECARGIHGIIKKNVIFWEVVLLEGQDPEPRTTGTVFNSP